MYFDLRVQSTACGKCGKVWGTRLWRFDETTGAEYYFCPTHRPGFVYVPVPEGRLKTRSGVLTDEAVSSIQLALSRGENATSIAQRFGILRKTVEDCIL